VSIFVLEKMKKKGVVDREGVVLGIKKDSYV
jgi:hypothetical protein